MDRLSTILEVFGFVAEAVLMLWLLVRGTDSYRWNIAAARHRGKLR
jgi:hypothetical protein